MNIHRPIIQTMLLLVLTGSLILSGCGPGVPQTESSGLGGRMLVWHSWTDVDAQALESILARFTEIHPDVRVKLTAIPAEELQGNFEIAAASGLGPDLLIGPHNWIRPLADADLIQQLDDRLEEDILQRFLPAALDTVRYQGNLYGLPVSLNTVALYYNRNLVEEPATTLDALLTQAAEGKSAAINTSFHAAFWGVQGFGGRLLDEEGRVILDRGGFANWLAWLKNAREQSGMLLDSNQEALSVRFQEGEVAYYVGDPTELSKFREALGEETVGVAPLPAGPTGNGGPFLGSQALMLSTVSSPNQSSLALSLAQFLTNSEQQTTLMRQARRVPANVRVRVSQRLNPAVAGFVAQSRTAVPMPNMAQMETITRQIGDAYIRVLEGVQEPVEAALEATNNINQALGFAVTTTADITCQGVGAIQLMHGWQGADSEALNAIIAGFARTCPTIIVKAQAVNPGELRSRFRIAASSGEDPDLVIGTYGWISEMAAAGLVREVTPWVESELLQQYRPRSVDAMRHQDRLYGLPVALRTQALYYNRQMVAEPARSLDELRLQATRERPVALNIGFDGAFWGIQAFGGRLFNEEYRVVLDQGSFAAWLAWLQEAKANPGFILSADDEQLRSIFEQGQAAYYVGSSTVLNELREALGEDVVGISPLPAGPEGDAGPPLQVEGFLFSTAATETQARLALEFARYATAAESQALLMEQADLVPANATVNANGSGAVTAFAEQASSAVLLASVPQMAAVQVFGGDAYVLVLEGALEPAEAADEVTRTINEANDMDSLAAEFSCEGEGTVSFWHALGGVQAEVYESIIADFGARCPGIQVAVEVLAQDELRSRFERSAETGAGPDLLLGPNEWSADLALQGLITDVTSLIPPLELSRMLPESVDAFRYQGRLYGIPESVNPVALFFNRNLVTEPAGTLDDLLAQAAEGKRVTLNTDFYHAFWGIQAFGGRLFNEEGMAVLDQGGFADWLAWLRNAERSTGMTLDNSREKLLALFRSGRAAYYTGSADELAGLQAALGQETVGVRPLPAGPEGSAGPFMRVEGFFLNANGNQQLAAQFARYVAGERSQKLLMENAGRVPANQQISTGLLPAIAGFAIQAETAVPVPSAPEMAAVWDLGNDAYRNVLNGLMDPQPAAAEAAQRINLANEAESQLAEPPNGPAN